MRASKVWSLSYRGSVEDGWWWVSDGFLSSLSPLQNGNRWDNRCREVAHRWYIGLC